jgi:hypothetical protein
MPHDYSRFTKRISVHASKKELYDCWATQVGLEKWFLREAEFHSHDKKRRSHDHPIQSGDTYEWRWHGWADDVAERGWVLEANGRDLFKFVFGHAGIVSVTIKEAHGEHIVELAQENIPTDEDSKINYYIGCQTGWTFYLTNLKSILEGGKDLRNKKTELKSVVNS